jgi:hypothetical protein
LEKVGHEISLAHWRICDFNKIPEVVVLERMLFPDVIEKFRLAGAKRIIGTFDDAYQFIPEGTPAHEFWNTPGRLDSFKDGIGMLDACIVPNHKLASDFSRYGNMKYVPNFIADELWEYREPVTHSPLVIFWGGTSGHKQTWERTQVIPALSELAKEFPGEFILEIHKTIPERVIESGIPLRMVPNWVTAEQWPNEVRKADIGIVPLNGEYDCRRSILKGLEFGAASIPYVASRMGEYEATKLEGCLQPPVGAGSAEFWYKALKKLILDREYRVELGKTGRKFAEGYFMERNIKAYETICFP